jgi:hypothetical protein
MEQFLINNIVLITIISMCWCLPWEAVALWRAARNNHKGWFIILFLTNTVAILEIIYIFGFSKRKNNKKIETVEK